MSTRVRSVDALRGAVLVLMALDHVRDYFSHSHIAPENLAQGSAVLFATRWITHFCAPAFALLAGVGIGLALRRGRSGPAMSRFLLTRGVWLIVLDLFVTPIFWHLNFEWIPAIALVLWALGLSMIVMAALIHLPKGIVATGAIVMIFTHNLLDGVMPASWGAFAPLWHVLHQPGLAIPPATLIVGYPLIPWVAVMALGWALSDVYDWEPARRRRLLIGAGVTATVLFVVIRWMNGYGNPMTWAPQRTPALTVASFLNLRKYPPSLDFLLMTLGPSLIALSLLESARGRVNDWLTTIGRVPLFFYCMHILVAHLLAVALAFWQSGTFVRIQVLKGTAAIPSWYGVSLPGVYLAWAVVVLLMYPLCRRFARLKQERRDWWLSYL